MKYADALLRWTQVKDSFCRFKGTIFVINIIQILSRHLDQYLKHENIDEKIHLNWTIEKQETVSVHQALNKEFLVDDTAIATHQISNKLDQLEKLVKKGESKSGHTLGELHQWPCFRIHRNEL